MRKISGVAAAAAFVMLSGQAMALKPMDCYSLADCLMGGRVHRVQIHNSRARGLHVVNIETKRPRANVQVASLYTKNIDAPNLSQATRRDLVDWNDDQYPVGSIIVQTDERALYYVMAGGRAMKYDVGVGREGFQWSGTSRIERKAEWPDWTPPAEMIEREAENGHIIPDFMPGGPGNPLGARALYLGGRIYRIHGTNNEASIGGAVSSGCIRMMNADIIDLYGRAKVGSKVWVY